MWPFSKSEPLVSSWDFCFPKKIEDLDSTPTLVDHTEAAPPPEAKVKYRHQLNIHLDDNSTVYYWHVSETKHSPSHYWVEFMHWYFGRPQSKEKLFEGKSELRLIRRSQMTGFDMTVEALSGGFVSEWLKEQ